MYFEGLDKEENYENTAFSVDVFQANNWPEIRQCTVLV